MKHLAAGALVTFALGFSATDPATAQTPDGITPANEGVCDPLLADGVTKELYGLCVAFCEAQDHATLSDPLTPDQFEELLQASPSGRILKAYNKRKTASDPAMPCVAVVDDDTCPCAIDGQFDLAGQGDSINILRCVDNLNEAPGSLFSGFNATQLWTAGSAPYYDDSLTVFDNHRDDLVQAFGEYHCLGYRQRTDEYTFRPGYEISASQAQACRDRVLEAAQWIGVPCE